MRKVKHIRKGASPRTVVYVIAVLTVALALGATGGAVAKYAKQEQNQDILAAKEFYFTSNLLGEEGDDKRYTLGPAAEYISFSLSNSEDSLRHSEDEVSYVVEIRSSAQSAGADPLYKTRGALAADTKSDVTIQSSGFDLQPGVTYSVTATGSAGYEKTLAASFTVSNEETVYKNLDASNPAYVLLTVWSNDVKGILSIDVPAGLIPDNTDSAMALIDNYDAGSDGYGSFKVSDSVNFAEPYSTHIYRFFVSKDVTASSLTADSFSVLLTDESADPADVYEAQKASLA